MENEQTIGDVLRTVETIAVVGCSRDEEKDAHEVPAFMKEMGYTIVPVNPNAEDVLELRTFDNLIDAYRNTDVPIDMVNVFRPSAELSGIVEETLAVDPQVLWTQLGIVDERAFDEARRAGIRVISNRCVYREYRNRFGSTPRSEIAGGDDE